MRIPLGHFFFHSNFEIDRCLAKVSDNAEPIQGRCSFGVGAIAFSLVMVLHGFSSGRCLIKWGNTVIIVCQKYIIIVVLNQISLVCKVYYKYRK